MAGVIGGVRDTLLECVVVAEHFFDQHFSDRRFGWEARVAAVGFKFLFEGGRSVGGLGRLLRIGLLHCILWVIWFIEILGGAGILAVRIQVVMNLKLSVRLGFLELLGTIIYLKLNLL